LIFTPSAWMTSPLHAHVPAGTHTVLPPVSLAATMALLIAARLLVVPSATAPYVTMLTLPDGCERTVALAPMVTAPAVIVVTGSATTITGGAVASVVGARYMISPLGVDRYTRTSTTSGSVGWSHETAMPPTCVSVMVEGIAAPDSCPSERTCVTTARYCPAGRLPPTARSPGGFGISMPQERATPPWTTPLWLPLAQ
jgi:hypothetical protein